MAARRERGLLDPDAARGPVALRPPDLLPRLRRRHRGGHHLRGVLAGRHPAAGQPDGDLRPQPHLDRGRHQHRPHRGHRRPLRGVRLARPEHRLDQRRHPVRRERRGLDAALERPAASPTGRASSACARSSAGRRRPSRTPARRTAPRSATTRSRPPRRSSASTRSRPSRSSDEVIGHTRELLDRGAAAQAEWQTGLRHLGRGQPGGQGALRPAGRRRADAPAGKRRCRAGTPTPRASPPAPPRARSSPRSRPRCLSCGAARPTWPSPTTPPRRASRASCRRTGRPRRSRAARTAGCCTSASASTPWARS